MLDTSHELHGSEGVLAVQEPEGGDDSGTEFLEVTPVEPLRPSQGIPSGRSLRMGSIKTLIDFSECDVLGDVQVSTPALPSSADVGAAAPSARTDAVGASALPLGAAQDQPSHQELLSENRDLRLMLKQEREAKDIEVSIVRRQLLDKILKIEEVMKERDDARASLRDMQLKLDTASGSGGGAGENEAEEEQPVLSPASSDGMSCIDSTSNVSPTGSLESHFSDAFGEQSPSRRSSLQRGAWTSLCLADDSDEEGAQEDQGKRQQRSSRTSGGSDRSSSLSPTTEKNGRIAMSLPIPAMP